MSPQACWSPDELIKWWIAILFSLYMCLVIYQELLVEHSLKHKNNRDYTCNSLTTYHCTVEGICWKKVRCRKQLCCLTKHNIRDISLLCVFLWFARNMLSVARAMYFNSRKASYAVWILASRRMLYRLFSSRIAFIV